jgi:recombination protein RecT
MAKKTVIKKVLKYAPLSTDVQRAISQDETIKSGLAKDMSLVEDETDYMEAEYSEVNSETGEVTNG